MENTLTMQVEMSFDSLKDLEYNISSSMIDLEKQARSKLGYDSIYAFLAEVDQVISSIHSIKREGGETVHFGLREKHRLYGKVRKDKDFLFSALVIIGSLFLIEKSYID